MNRFMPSVLPLIVLLLASGCSNPPVVPVPTANQTNFEPAIALAAAVPYPELDEVRRGCPACHSKVDAISGKYTIAWEAYQTSPHHPEIFGPTDDVKVTLCLECHSPGTGDREGKGTKSPMALMDILHPAHMSSQVFKLHYGGSCFSCHNIDGKGNYWLLTEKVTVDSNGVPDPTQIPIPGAIPIP